MAKKRVGYNWKARQQVKKLRKDSTQETDSMDKNEVEDTNYEVIPEKQTDINMEKREHKSQRRKLSARERKRLQRVVEIKRKKSQHVATLESLRSCSLPDSQLSLLQSSSQLGRARNTRGDILKEFRLQDYLQELTKGSKKARGEITSGSFVGHIPSLVGTSWNSKSKKRKRRMLRVEKIACAPRIEEDVDTVRPSEDRDSCGDSSDDSLDLDDVGDVRQDLQVESTGLAMEESVEPVEGNSEIRKSQSENGKDDVPVSAITGEAAVSKQQVGAVKYIQLPRDPDVQCARLALPILSEEQVIMEAIHDNSVVVLCGETGSGKTTQVPQFLYEAGYCQRGVAGERSLIGVTEPRRVAAVSMAARVGIEMGVAGTGKVGYQIRYEGSCTADTEIKFMTDGVLLKEVEQDFLLSQYSVVVVDEAHERSVFTDIMVGLLSRIVPLREKNGNPLKLVIMSATLRVEDFTENKLLFPIPPPIIRVESRQYPVTIHFNRRTPDDYVDATFRKTCKIHRSLQPGAILVFVTGQKEVHTLCRRLSKRFPAVVGKRGGASLHTYTGCGGDRDQVDLDSYSVVPSGPCDSAPAPGHLPGPQEDEEGATLEEEEEGFEFSEEEDAEEFHDSQLPLKVLPLYSLLSPAQQRKVFQSPPEGVRLCVVATNVAETSLTLPGVKYVVDCGKVKRRFYDKVTGISTYRVCWTSKSSANQRAGRAGRTEPGHCYRLYSSAVYHNIFEEFSPPEITRRPVEDLVLQMKAMNIDRVANFPFPTPPSLEAIRAAEEVLWKLGALETKEESPGINRFSSSHHRSYFVTSLGCTMANFPLAPRYAKMLSIAEQHGCLPYVIALVSALSVREVFVSGGGGEGEESEAVVADRWTKLYRSWVGKGESLLLGDLMVLLRAVGAWEFSSSKVDFCERNGLRHKAMLEIRKLRQQLTNLVNASLPGEGVTLEPRMAPLSPDQVNYMRQIVLTGLGHHVARKIPTQGLSVEDQKRLNHAYQCTLCEDSVYLPSSSVLYYENPEYVIFQEVTETSKLYLRGVCAVDPSWLPLIQPKYCTFSDPLEDPPPAMDDCTGHVYCHRICTYGSLNWPLGVHRLLYPKCLVLFKLFAMFLLQGKVLPDFGKLSASLLVAPIALIRKWSKLHSQCEMLVAALANKDVASRDALLSVWEKDPNYLLRAYLLWLPESKHKEVVPLWPFKNN